MSASAIVPLTVTYAPSAAPTTTVTVLGQVLNNGGTNWIPGTKGSAIYLATTSEADASTTVLDGTTYYLTLGPAVPAQVTITVSSSASASAGATSPTAALSSSGASMESGSTTSMDMESSSTGAPTAASSSSSMGGAWGTSVSCVSAGRLGIALGLLCGLGVVM